MTSASETVSLPRVLPTVMIDAAADYIFQATGAIFPIAPLWEVILSAAPASVEVDEKDATT